VCTVLALRRSFAATVARVVAGANPMAFPQTPGGPDTKVKCTCTSAVLL
jgi:hypothetical protein